MRRDDSLDPAKLKQVGGRPRIHTVEKLLAVLKGKKLSTKNWLEKASLETGVSRARFYALLGDARRLPQVKQTKKGQWFYDVAPNE